MTVAEELDTKAQKMLQMIYCEISVQTREYWTRYVMYQNILKTAAATARFMQTGENS